MSVARSIDNVAHLGVFPPSAGMWQAALVVVGVKRRGVQEPPLIRGAQGHLRQVLGLVQPRQQNRDQQGKDGDDDQHLDQGEGRCV